MGQLAQSVLSASVRAVIEGCASLGIDRALLLEKAGLDPRDLEDPDGRIAVPVAGAVWHEAERISQNPAIALRAAEALPQGAYRIADYLVAHSATLGEGLQRLANYFALIAEPIAIDVIEQEGLHWLQLRSTHAAAPLPRYAEFTLASIVVRTRRAWRLDWRPTRVAFRFAEPRHAREHRRLFDSPVVFSQECDGLAIDSELWTAKLSRADPDLLQILEDHARRLLAELPTQDDLIAATRQQICRVLPGEELTIATIARKLGMSIRSLQRKLRESGTSFASVLDDVRREMAKFHLAQGDSAIAEIAHLLGFADQSTFQRAFKRWTGTTPRRFRQESATPAAP